MIKSNFKTLVILIIGLIVASFYACSEDSQTALTSADLNSGLDLRGGDTTCMGHPPHDSLWFINHPHDSLWVGGHHHHHPHDSLWIINHPIDTTGGHHPGGPKGGGPHGGGHTGGGHPGGGHGHH